jgi:hypothetical protein
MSLVVNIGFDPENKLYFVHDSDVPGLTVEAASVDEVIEIVRDVAPDLIGETAARAEFDFRLKIPAIP